MRCAGRDWNEPDRRGQCNDQRPADLELAWLWRGDNYAPYPEATPRSTPVYVDGVLFDSGTSDALITDVQIVFSFDKNKNSSNQSIFQPMGVDLLRINGAVPEPHHFTTLALLCGLLFAFAMRRTKWGTT